MYRESFNGNDGTYGRNGGNVNNNTGASTFYSQEDFSLKINEGSLSEPSYFSPIFSKPHLDIYSSNRYLDTFLFHRSTFL